MRRLNLIGRRFGELEVLSLAHRKTGHSFWLCLCDCGKRWNVIGSALTNGSTKRCLNCNYKQRTKHGFAARKLKRPREYNSWNSMRDRCNNSNATSFRNYGGRGIRICKRWDSFENFFADMGIRPANTTLDRKNNNGNYHKRNCRWATRKSQACNRRTCRNGNG